MNKSHFRISVIIPTHNPDLDRLDRVLASLARQTLARELWELLIIDNMSTPPVLIKADIERLSSRIICEPRLGLTSARWRGVEEALSDLIVFVDDDNLISDDYLEEALSLFERFPSLGAIGGKSLPVYEVPPPSWFREGMAPLGCRDLGEQIKIMEANDFTASRAYPTYSPIGAGMVVRKKALDQWLGTALSSNISDRRGDLLSSAGDCDIVLYVLEAGWDVGYSPALTLDHLISASRVSEKYMQAISRAAFRDFIRVLDKHQMRPWSSIHPATVPLRILKSWFIYQPWRSSERKLRWHSAIGQYEGRALLPE